MLDREPDATVAVIAHSTAVARSVHRLLADLPEARDEPACLRVVGRLAGEEQELPAPGRQRPGLTVRIQLAGGQIESISNCLNDEPLSTLELEPEEVMLFFGPQREQRELISLAGMPPTAGFIGKFYLFSGALKAGYLWLAIIGVMNSAASVYYYLRVMVYMYMKEPFEDFSWMKLSPAIMLSIVISVIGVLVPGIIPTYLLDLAQKAVML